MSRLLAEIAARAEAAEIARQAQFPSLQLEVDAYYNGIPFSCRISRETYNAGEILKKRSRKPHLLLLTQREADAPEAA